MGKGPEVMSHIAAEATSLAFLARKQGVFKLEHVHYCLSISIIGSYCQQPMQRHSHWLAVCLNREKFLPYGINIELNNNYRADI